MFSEKKYPLFGLNIFISNQFIQYNTIFNHTNIRIRTEPRAYQVLLLYLCEGGIENPSPAITICHHSASLIMPIGDPRDCYFQTCDVIDMFK